MTERGALVSPNPLVSVIIPAYRVADYIGEALESALAQTFRDHEMIVVNDGCPQTDALEKVLQPYRARIVYMKQENRGLAGARNTAVRASRAPLIAPLDGDDLWEPDYLSEQAALLQNDPSIDVASADARNFGAGSKVGSTFMERYPHSGEVTFESVLSRACNVPIFSVIRKTALVRAGLYDESLRGAEDLDLWLRILRGGGRIVLQKKVLAKYRRRDDSLSAQIPTMCDLVLRVYEKALRTMELSAEERRMADSQIARFRARKAFVQAKIALTNGDYITARLGFAEANRYYRRFSISVFGFLLGVFPGGAHWIARRLSNG